MLFRSIEQVTTKPGLGSAAGGGLLGPQGPMYGGEMPGMPPGMLPGRMPGGMTEFGGPRGAMVPGLGGPTMRPGEEPGMPPAVPNPESGMPVPGATASPGATGNTNEITKVEVICRAVDVASGAARQAIPFALHAELIASPMFNPTNTVLSPEVTPDASGSTFTFGVTLGLKRGMKN